MQRQITEMRDYMDKVRRTLAMIGVIVIVICAILTLIFDLFLQILDEGKLHDRLGRVGDFSNAWKASAWCMVVIPAFIYAMLLIYRILNGRGTK